MENLNKLHRRKSRIEQEARRKDVKLTKGYMDLRRHLNDANFDKYVKEVRNINNRYNGINNDIEDATKAEQKGNILHELTYIKKLTTLSGGIDRTDKTITEVQTK